MSAREMLIICGEWETGSTPPRFSGEEYNVDLEIKEIVRHPDFKPEVGVDGGVESVLTIVPVKLWTFSINCAPHAIIKLGVVDDTG